jgi:ubiquitin carboxyl-terminal hydrolase 14
MMQVGGGEYLLISTVLSLSQVLHMVLPRFSDKDDHGHFMQQDANEFLTELLRVFQQKLIVRESSGAVAAAASDRNTSVIDRYLGGTFQVTLKNLESADEPIELKTEKFVQLSCFLSQEVKYMQLGVKSKLVEEITKNSTILGRDAKYQRTAEIARLPAYLCIQMVRFFYKERDKV